MVDLALVIYPQLLNTIQRVIHRFSTIYWAFPHNGPHLCRSVSLMLLAGEHQRPENGVFGVSLSRQPMDIRSKIKRTETNKRMTQSPPFLRSSKTVLMALSTSLMRPVAAQLEGVGIAWLPAGLSFRGLGCPGRSVCCYRHE